MNRQNIQIKMPDGDVRLVTIEGGNAEDTARLLANHYLGQGSVAPASRFSFEVEPPLPTPAMEFEEPKKAHARKSPKTPVVSVSNANDEEPVLALPTLNFA